MKPCYLYLSLNVHQKESLMRAQYQRQPSYVFIRQSVTGVFWIFTCEPTNMKVFQLFGWESLEIVMAFVFLVFFSLTYIYFVLTKLLLECFIRCEWIVFIAFGGHFTGEDNKLLEEKKKVFEELSKQVDELYKKKVG